MRNLPFDGNNAIMQWSALGNCKNFEAGVIDQTFDGYIRVKNIGEEMAAIRYQDQTGSDGLHLSPDETEYLRVERGRKIEVIAGTVNIMY